MNKLLSSVALIALITTGISGMAHAQTSTDAPAPAVPAIATPSIDGVNQINKRLQDQQKRIESGVSSGKLTADQAAIDQKNDAKVADKLSKDEAKNGGTITADEQAKLNKKLDKNGHRMHHQMNKTFTPVAAPASAPVTAPAQ